MKLFDLIYELQKIQINLGPQSVEAEIKLSDDLLFVITDNIIARISIEPIVLVDETEES